MTTAVLITAIVVAGLVALIAIAALSDVRIAKHTGLDPRLDDKARAEAAERVAARKRHPSNGDHTEENR